MKDNKYEIIEKRTIVIKYDNKTFKAEIPIDFIVTEKWIEEKMSEPDLKRCEDWLLNKGFTKNKNNRWDYLKAKKIHLNLPKFFIDHQNFRLIVKFGEINASSFYIPNIGMGYRTLHDLPWVLPEKCRIEKYSSASYYSNNHNWRCSFDFDIYKKFMLSNSDEVIDDSYYFSEILKRLNTNDYTDKKEIEKIKRFLDFNKDYLSTNEDYLNLTKSLLTIDKFNL